jgi:glycosyltransferase involved in cell wall biosynthesis
MERKIRVVRVFRSLGIGGIERGIVSILPRIAPERYEFAVCTITERGELADELAAQGIEVVHIPVRHRSDLQGLMMLARYMRAGKFDIVHTHSFFPNVPGRVAAVLARVPIRIAHHHNLFSKKCKHRKHAIYEWALSHVTDAIIAVSHGVKDDLVRTAHINPRKITVIYNGIDLAPFRAPVDVEALRRELGVGERRVIGCVGRLVPAKGHMVLLEAAREVVREFPDVVFLFIGDGKADYRRKLEEYISRLGLEGAVQLLGTRRDVAALMRIMDVSVLPSLYEGFGRVAAESLASGRAFVGSSVAGINEIVKHGESGLLVPPKDSKALAEAIIRLLKDRDEAQRFGDAGRRTAEQFTLDRMARETAVLYDSLISKRLR